MQETIAGIVALAFILITHKGKIVEPYSTQIIALIVMLNLDNNDKPLENRLAEMLPG